MANRAGGGGIQVGDVATNLVLTDSIVDGNSATSSLGGGIFGGFLSSVMLMNSTVSSNCAEGSFGGIRGNTVTLTQSTVSGNSSGGSGGGIHGRFVTLVQSTVRDNSAATNGGGIVGLLDVMLYESSVTGNIAAGQGSGDFNGRGGGVFDFSGISLMQSTISGNTAVSGGGVFHFIGDVTFFQSTIIDNSALEGGGVHFQYPYYPYSTSLLGSIVANNAASTSPDLHASFNSVMHSLIGNNAGTGLLEAPIGMPDANGNLIGGSINGVIDPMLGPLQDNGGPTFTHALVAGSPAIDAGDPTAVAGAGDIPEFDQRGMPYGRVEDGDGDTIARIDMGAVEMQPVTTIDGDFNDDMVYDCLDIDALVAEIALGTNNPAFDLTGDSLVNFADRDAWLSEAAMFNGLASPYKLGDATLDGVVDGNDFIAWNANKFTNVAEWCAGDFTADGVVDGLDFIEWNANKFTSSLRPMIALTTDALGATADLDAGQGNSTWRFGAEQKPSGNNLASNLNRFSAIPSLVARATRRKSPTAVQLGDAFEYPRLAAGTIDAAFADLDRIKRVL